MVYLLFVYVMLSQSVVSDCSGHLRRSRKPLVDMTLRWKLGKVSPTQWRNLHISRERNHCQMVSCSLCKPCILAMQTVTLVKGCYAKRSMVSTRLHGHAFWCTIARYIPNYLYTRKKERLKSNHTQSERLLVSMHG